MVPKLRIWQVLNHLGNSNGEVGQTSAAGKSAPLASVQMTAVGSGMLLLILGGQETVGRPFDF